MNLDPHFGKESKFLRLGSWLRNLDQRCRLSQLAKLPVMLMGDGCIGAFCFLTKNGTFWWWILKIKMKHSIGSFKVSFCFVHFRSFSAFLVNAEGRRLNLFLLCSPRWWPPGWRCLSWRLQNIAWSRNFCTMFLLWNQSKRCSSAFCVSFCTFRDSYLDAEGLTVHIDSYHSYRSYRVIWINMFCTSCTNFGSSPACV